MYNDDQKEEELRKGEKNSGYMLKQSFRTKAVR